MRRRNPERQDAAQAAAVERQDALGAGRLEVLVARENSIRHVWFTRSVA